MQSNFLGQEKISKLLFKQAMPAIFGMLVMSLYNIVDAIFIGRGVGTLALAGVSVSVPFIMSLLAISLSIGIGSASIISRALGAKDYNKVKQVYGNYVLLITIISILVIGFSYIFLTPIIKFFGATPDVLKYALDYTSIIILGSAFLLFASSANNIIRATGHAGFAMTTVVIGAIINIILDPIFIFYFNLGVKGAAYATIFSWFVSSVYVIYYYLKISEVAINLHHLKFKAHITKEIFTIGSSSFARQGSMSILTVVVNNVLSAFGTGLALAAFGIISRLTMLAIMPIFGVVQGMQPIIGFNWGEKKYQRVKDALLLSLKATSYTSLLIFIILLLFTTPIISIFSKDTELINFTANALKVIILTFPLIGIQTVTSGLYQALGKARPAFFLSILRQLILLVPLVLLLPQFFKLSGVWYSFPIADLLASMITFIFLYKELKLINQLIKK